MLTAWLYLFSAGLFEIGFTTCMKLSKDFTHLWYTLGFVVCAAFSFWLLNKSLSQIPLGTAYAVWTGIGAFGTAVIGMLYFNDPVSTGRIVLLLILIGSILGLKIIATGSPN